MKKLISGLVLVVMLISQGAKVSYADDGCIVDAAARATGQLIVGTVETAAAILALPFLILSGGNYYPGTGTNAYSYTPSAPQAYTSAPQTSELLKRNAPRKPAGVEFWTSDEYQG